MLHPCRRVLLLLRRDQVLEALIALTEALLECVSRSGPDEQLTSCAILSMANGVAPGRDPKLARPVGRPLEGMNTVKEDVSLDIPIYPRSLGIEHLTCPSDSGQARLEQLGYSQELDRKFGMLSSFSASFSLCSFMFGIVGKHPTFDLVDRKRQIPICPRQPTGAPSTSVLGWLTDNAIYIPSSVMFLLTFG